MAHTKRKKEILKKLPKETAHNKQTLAKEFAALEDEELTEMGQESEIKGAKAVIEVDNEISVDENTEYQRDINYLLDAIKAPQRYLERLLKVAQRQASLEQFDPGYIVAFLPDPKGIGLMVRTPDQRMFARKFAACFDPKIDTYMILRYIDDVFGLMDRLAVERVEKAGFAIPKSS